jgi:hypothetical protein
MPVNCTPTGASQFYSARSRHHGGVNVCNCDGSVHFVLNTISTSVWSAMGTMNGGEVATGIGELD